MREKITENIKNIKELESLYRSNPELFSAEFNEIYPLISEEPEARFWFTRLNYAEEPADTAINEITQPEKKISFVLLFTIIASLAAGTIAKLPVWLSTEGRHEWIDSFPFVVFPLLIVYFLIKNKASKRKSVLILIIVIVSAVFLNFLPSDGKNQTHYLAAIHMFLLMWVLWGLAFTGSDYRLTKKRLDFYKLNGDMLVLTAVILCGGIVLTFLTFGLFMTIKVRIEDFYFNYVVVYGLSAAPFVANYILENNSTIVNKVAPYIAKIFTPLVLITMTCFLIALIFYSKDPFNNRDELITYNILLIVILAIIVFAFTGRQSEAKSFYIIVFIALLVEAVIINSVALSAIIYRTVQFGISPNRAAVIGGNILMFINIAVIIFQLFKFIKNGSNNDDLNRSVTFMLPVYAAWTVFVSFVFPFIFWFS